jgi:hypothetical protein
MSADNAQTKTPAATWAWLTRQLSGLDEMPGRSIRGEWSKFKSKKDGQGTKGSSITDWPPDFWIAKTQNAHLSPIEPVWAIPERLDQWPTLEMQDPFVSTLPGRTRTNSASFLEVLARTDPTHVRSGSDPIPRFFVLDKSSTTHGDGAMVSANQIRAWLTTAFGDLLSAIALTPVDDDQTRELLVQEVTKRIADVDSLSNEDRRLSFLDYGCQRVKRRRLDHAA